MKIAVTGSSGMIGSAVVREAVRQGHEVIRLVRRPASAADEVTWDPLAGTLDAAALEGVEGVVHLAGSSIAAHRWTRRVKAEILHSRVAGTQLLATTFSQMDNPPRVWLSGSASGFYGDRGDEYLTEASPAGAGFRADVVLAWEAATAEAPKETRVVHLRTGNVLTMRGGLLPYLVMPFRAGLGGPIGSGAQWVPWVSLEDQVGVICFLLASADVAGSVNIVGPQPARQRDLAWAIGRVLRRPARVRAPAWAVRIGAGAERAREALLSSQRMVPDVLVAAGYTFRHATLLRAIEAAFQD